MTSLHVMRLGVFALLAAFVSSGCLTRARYEYFEPSGAFRTVGSPREWGKLESGGVELQISCRLNEAGHVLVHVYAEIPPGATLRFSGDQATLVSDAGSETFTLTWREGFLQDGSGDNRQVPFDAPLQPGPPRGKYRETGLEPLGVYTLELVLPGQYDAVRDFVLTLPAPVGGEPIRIAFVRRQADYIDSVPLQ